MTFQELEALKDNESTRKEFVQSAIRTHMGTKLYKFAEIAERYYAKKNVTISQFQKFLYNMRGETVPDIWSANYKLKTLFFRRFVIQQVQYVLSNGVTFDAPETKEALGKSFDFELQSAAKRAMVDGVSFGFWNFDHMEVFSLVETDGNPGFVPLYDEDTGALRAGIRYWHITKDNKTTLNATLYEADGYTSYIKRDNEDIQILEEKRGYNATVTSTEAGGASVSYSNPDKFPIIPLYANDLHESELQGIRESIDCYDYIKSGLANDIDDTSGFYWVLKNTGGMDDTDLAKFVERMHTVKAATVDADSGVAAEAHTFEIPVDSREKMLEILEKDLYKDFQLLNVSELSATAKTATEIRAAYQPQDDKCGDFEYCLIDFIHKILAVAGLDDEPKFKWNRIANQTEETQMVITAAMYLDQEAVLKHLPWLTPEEVGEILDRSPMPTE